MNDPQKPGLYVHFPFCKTKCPYCDFYSTPSVSLVPDWIDALREETLLHKDRFAQFDTVYLGGGTPSLLSFKELDLVIQCLRKAFSISPCSEFTLEANPDDLTAEKLGAYSSLGINRLSLGVQSFDEQALRFLKRRHTALQAASALEKIKHEGAFQVGVDLMYGLPGQSEFSWLKTLEQTLRFEPEHISCYELTFEGPTPFAKMLAEGKINALCEEEERAFFILTSTFLQEHGYVHYEISNFSRGEENASRHNKKYWQQAPYLGLGPSAHSFQEGDRWWNVRDTQAYCQSLKQGLSPLAGKETLSQEQRRLESLMLGFRTRQGILRSLITCEPGFEAVIRDLQNSGLVEISQKRISPTLQGFLVADSIPLLFER